MCGLERPNLANRIATTVQDIIRRVLPEGSPRGSRSWSTCPPWPPDVFAVVGTLVFASSCHQESGLILHQNNSQRDSKRAAVAAAKAMAESWDDPLRAPKDVQRQWDLLIADGNAPVDSEIGQGRDWKWAALRLLIAADEACAGIGYRPEGEAKGAAQLVWSEISTIQKSNLMPMSLTTEIVPPSVVTVLPKAMTPEAGCTLRSLTHNLALLPGAGVVRAEWRLIGEENIEQEVAGPNARRPLNLLLIPFPYVVHGKDFHHSRPLEADDPGEDPKPGYFWADNSGWLSQCREANKGWWWECLNWHNAGADNNLADFVGELITAAEKDVGAIHGIIFPEAALTEEIAVSVSGILLDRFKTLEFMTCGTAWRESREGPCHNEAVTFHFYKGERSGTHRQAKHHRWRLDSRQIRQYQLGGILDPTRVWWEDITLHNRTITFGLNRDQAVIATLICEDLARHDPVLPAVMAVGPTLLIVLLMDGPQLTARWPARYATVLADDPGCSVLTLTCLGMLRRTQTDGNDPRNVIGLWKDRTQLKELVLPPGALGLVLSLTNEDTTQITVDGRSDGQTTVEYRLGGQRPVRIKGPPWLET